MAGCFHPLPAVYDRKNRKLIKFNGTLEDFFALNSIRTGKSIVELNADRFEDICLPCGHCVGCSLKRSLDWCCRICAEQHYQLYDVNGGEPLPCCFVTLTYDNEHLPFTEDGLPTLNYKHVRKFLQDVDNLYNRYGLSDGKPWRAYYLCGEYGEQFGRPHYHIVFIGLDFFELDRLLAVNDRSRLSKFEKNFDSNLSSNVAVCNGRGGFHYNTPLLSRCWNKGFAVVAPLKDSMIAYTTGYVDKKVLCGTLLKEYYGTRQFEKNLMSKAIGKEFFKKYYDSLYNLGYIQVSDRKYCLPRAFDRWLEKIDYARYEQVKQDRLAHISTPEFILEHSPERLAVKEEILVQKYKARFRPYEQAGNIMSTLERKVGVL